MGWTGRVLLILVAVATLGSSETIQWSPAKRGIRVGMHIVEDGNDGRAIEFVIQNQGTRDRDIDLANISLGLAQNLQLRVIREGITVDVFDRELLKAGVAGFVQPGSIHLASGQQRRFSVPFKRLLCVVNRRDVPLEQMLESGYRISATFISSGDAIVLPHIEIR